MPFDFVVHLSFSQRSSEADHCATTCSVGDVGAWGFVFHGCAQRARSEAGCYSGLCDLLHAPSVTIASIPHQNVQLWFPQSQGRFLVFCVCRDGGVWIACARGRMHAFVLLHVAW